MAISDKLMDIKVLVEKYLDQDEIDKLYELTEGIEVLEQKNDLELQKLREIVKPSSVPQANELLPLVRNNEVAVCDYKESHNAFKHYHELNYCPMCGIKL